jgi:hypothetical protein
MATDMNEETGVSKSALKKMEKAAAELAASKINPDIYWALYMSFKAVHHGKTNSWNRVAFLEYLKEAVAGVDVQPDNTRIYQKHSYCWKRFEALLEAGKIPKFDRDDFPLPPTSRGIGEEAFVKLANDLY